MGGGPVGKRKGRQIAGQSNPTGDDNVGFRTRAPQPFAASLGQILQVHPRLPSDVSRLANEPLLHILRFRPLDGAGFATRSPRPARRRWFAHAAATSPCAAPSDASAARAAPGLLETLRNRAGNRADPPLETPYTLSHTPGRSIALIRPSTD